MHDGIDGSAMLKLFARDRYSEFGLDGSQQAPRREGVQAVFEQVAIRLDRITRQGERPT